MIQVHFFNRLAGNLHVVRLGIHVAFFLRIQDEVLHAAALGGINVVELVDDRFFGRDQRCHFQPRDALDVINGQHVERVGHGQEQLVIQAGNRNDLVVMRQFARQQIGHVQRDADAGEVDRGGVEDPAHGNRHVLLADVGLFEDQFKETGALLFLLFEQFFDLPGGEQTIFHQGVGDPFSKSFDRRHSFIGRLCEGASPVQREAPDTTADD